MTLHETPASAPPIACSLTAPDLRARKAQITLLARRALRARRPVPHGALLTFAGDADTEARLRELVAAEARCCPFLTIDVRQAPDSIEVQVTGPDEAQPLIQEWLT